MALTNAEKQKRWRDKRNALAKEAMAIRLRNQDAPAEAPKQHELNKNHKAGIDQGAEYLGVPAHEMLKFVLDLGWEAFNRKFQHGLTNHMEWWLIEMHSKYRDTFNYGAWEGSCGELAIDRLYEARKIPVGKYQEWKAEQDAKSAEKKEKADKRQKERLENGTALKSETKKWYLDQVNWFKAVQSGRAFYQGSKEDALREANEQMEAAWKAHQKALKAWQAKKDARPVTNDAPAATES